MSNTQMKATRPDVGNPALGRNEREALNAFGTMMFRKLIANSHKGGWKDIDIERLYERLQDEFEELKKALDNYLRIKEELAQTKAGPHLVEKELDFMRAGQHLASECADLGNFSMFIADVAGGLEYDSNG